MPSLEKMAKEARIKKKTSKPKQPAKKAPSPIDFKSTEYIQESDEEENTSAESSSNNESLPKYPADAAPKANRKLPAPSGSSSSSENESGSEERSESEEQSGSEGEESDTSEKNAPVVLEPAKKSKVPGARPVSLEQTAPYKPPGGFELGSMDESSGASQLFRKSNLAGKQIWYFTAPASVPVSSIEQMSLQDAKEGNPIFSHEGSEYGFIQDSAADTTYTKIMVPNTSDNGYRISSTQIDKVLHLQQIVKLPGVNEAGTSSMATVPAEKPVRHQPEGLKMRFRPIGFGSGDTGSMDASEDEDSVSDKEMGYAPAFRQPAAVESEPSGKGEPTESDDVMAEALPPPKSASKLKHEKSSKKGDSTKNSVNGSLKRKHGGGKEKKSKSSSYQPYQPSDIDDRQLKRLKKK